MLTLESRSASHNQPISSSEITLAERLNVQLHICMNIMVLAFMQEDKEHRHARRSCFASFMVAECRRRAGDAVAAAAY